MRDWARVKIKELLAGQWPGEWGSDSEPSSANAVVYRSTELDDDGHVLQSDVRRSIPESKLSAKKLKPEDILLEASGGTPGRAVGRVGLYSPAHAEVAISSNFLRTLRPRADVHAAYLRWVLLQLHRRPEIWRFQQQTTGMSNLHVRDYLSHELDVAPVLEQRRIAEILAAVDEAIEQTEALITKTQQVTAGLMHDLFTRGVAPDGQPRPASDEAPKLYKESRLGSIPKEWTLSTVGECLLGIDAGHSPECPDTPARGEQWGVLKVSAVNPEGFREDENKTVLDTRLHDPALLVRPGDLLVSRANTVDLVGMVCYVDVSPRNLMLSDKTLRLRTKSSQVWDRFLYWSLQLRRTRQQIENAASGTSGSMKNISQQSIRALRLALPGLEEQARIAARVDAAATARNASIHEASKLRRLKAGLMDDLLTSRVRVPVAEAQKATANV
jgi:type I restriction enzyme S subunit